MRVALTFMCLLVIAVPAAAQAPGPRPKPAETRTLALSGAALGTIKARTLIVHGDRDEFFPVEIPVEMYRSIPRSELWIVPGGDHVPIFGARLRSFAEVAIAFLQGKPTPR